MKYIVLLAAYGYSEFLDQQVKSINDAFSKAKLKGLVYISIDGTWDSEKIYRLRKHFFSNLQIKVLKGPQRGVNHNFTFLSNTVASKYDNFCCFYSDHDDVWLKNKVRTYVELIKKSDNKDFLIFSDSSLFSAKGQIKKTLWSELSYDGQRLQPRKLLIKNYVQGATICASSNVVKAYAYMQNDYIMFDHVLAFIAALRGCIIPVREPLIRYRIHEENLIGIGKKRKYTLDRLRYFIYRISYFTYFYIMFRSRII